MYTSQWFPHNGNCRIHNGYNTIITVPFTMAATQLELYTSQWLNTMVTVHFTMATHNSNCTVYNGYHTMVMIHFTAVMTQR